jgi:hypothetical protein
VGERAGGEGFASLDSAEVGKSGRLCYAGR